MTKVRSFHGIATLYRKFIQNFSNIVTPITYGTKGTTFKWTNEDDASFKFLIKKVIEAPILSLPDLEKVYEVDYYASHVGIGVVLSQVGRLVSF